MTLHLQTAEGLPGHTGPAGRDHRGLLEDALGTQLHHRCHAHQATRDGTGNTQTHTGLNINACSTCKVTEPFQGRQYSRILGIITKSGREWCKMFVQGKYIGKDMMWRKISRGVHLSKKSWNREAASMAVSEMTSWILSLPFIPAGEPLSGSCCFQLVFSLATVKKTPINKEVLVGRFVQF